MALREIVKKGDDILVKKCREVVKFDDRLTMLIDDMIDTLRDSGGVGLAAPQVGMLRRVVVIEIDEEQGVIELVNPEIIEASGKQVGLFKPSGTVGNILAPLQSYRKGSGQKR